MVKIDKFHILRKQNLRKLKNSTNWIYFQLALKQSVYHSPEGVESTLLFSEIFIEMSKKITLKIG